MRKIITIILFCIVSFSSFSSTLEREAKSGNAAAAFKLAEFYENQNDLKNAMLWYKESARLSIQSKEESFAKDNKLVLLNEKAKHEQIEKNNLFIEKELSNKDNTKTADDWVSMNPTNENNHGFIQLMDSAFGLRPYHSNYILPTTYDFSSHDDGRKHFETAFQISFKKDIFTNTFNLDETIGFAYTQRNWWQITESSSPFRETNYLPEMYVHIPNSNKGSMLKGFQFGFLHESNGQGDEAGRSRSWNRLYLEGNFHYKDITVVPRVWYKIYENKKHDDNHDIEDYLGYGDFSISMPYKKHLVKVMIRNNLKFNDNHGAIQADWTYPLGDTGLFGYVQYFYGYGENLIDYDKKTNRIGVGIALSR